jgi:hypothetical protein
LEEDKMAQSYAEILSAINNTELRIALEAVLTNLGVSLSDTASTSVDKDIVGDVTGDLTGDVTGDVEGNITIPETAETTIGLGDLDDGDFPTSFITITNAIAGNVSKWTPTPGKFYIITAANVDAGSFDVTLTLGATYDGTNDIATFDAIGESLILFAISATRLLIIENIGSVALSFSGA